MRRWLVIIARDRPELWVTWASFYGGAEQVEVLCDRRQGQSGTERRNRLDRRTTPHRDTDLQERGFLVIRRPEMVGTFR
jgi:hypothetical protein